MCFFPRQSKCQTFRDIVADIVALCRTCIHWLQFLLSLAQGPSVPVKKLLGSSASTGPPMTLAFRCVEASVAYRTSKAMAEKSESVCSKGDAFFGKRLTAKDGSLWLSNESNALFLPLVHPKLNHRMFEEVHYTCTFKGTVQARSSPEVSDTSESWVKTGQSISALPVPEHPGWLIEADSKLYYPMNHPKTGDAIFKRWNAKADDLEEADLEVAAKGDQTRLKNLAWCLFCGIPTFAVIAGDF